MHTTDGTGAHLERKRRVFIEPDLAGNRIRVGAADGTEVGRILRKVDESRVRYRLGTTGVGDVDELLKKFRVLGVVPVPKDDGELLVIRMDLRLWVDNERRTETVDVLALDKV